MAVVRIQLTTYIDEDRNEKWQRIKERHGVEKDAEMLRLLIDGEFDRLEAQPQIEIADLLKRIEALEAWKASVENGLR